MKIAVYAIAKNESKNLDGWYKNISNADYVLILDTGSDDDTVEKARGLGITVFEASIFPWDEARAKNIAMSLLPKDIDFCICVDLDEHISSPNWKECFTEKMIPGIYLTTSIGLDGINRFERPVKNVHPRFGYYWKGFRSSITPYPKYNNVASNPELSIYTEAVAGDQDRFSNRDPLYVQSFLNHVLMLQDEKQQIGSSLQTALAYLALSYYEIEDYKSFEKIYNIFLNGVDQLGEQETNLQFVEVLDYAMAMVRPSLAESIYLKWIPKSKNPMVPLSRLIMFLSLSENKKIAKTYLDLYESKMSEFLYKETEDIMDTKLHINSLVFDSIGICKKIALDQKVTKNEINIVLEAYSAIGWGKPHKDLALKAIDCGKI